MTTTAGEKKDLGTLKFTPPDNNAEAKPPMPKEKTAEFNEVHGRVLLPDGKPAVGAKVLALRHYWNQAVKRAPLARTIAGAEGQIHHPNSQDD